MNVSPFLLACVIVGYFLLLMVISFITGKKGDNANFFSANKESPWILVAIGMIGASLSGATFISLPGVVGGGKYNMAFSYMQMVLGYLLGYFVIATVLLPVYYKMGLTSIYEYLRSRFGKVSHRTGAFYFLLSRIIGASFRLFLVAIVLQRFVMDAYGISFGATVALAIILIWVYTYRGGIKTIVWTDTLQTICMLTAVTLTIWYIKDALSLDLAGIWDTMDANDLTQVFFFEGGWSDPNNFFKQFISGALMAIVMTGLDQDMMQKNLTCRTLQDSQKNIFVFSIILIFANILFLSLGALLYIYAGHLGLDIPERTDLLYPVIALEHLSPVIGIVFVLGLIAAAYSSADSALTSLTTSFCVDFLGFKDSDKSENEKRKTRWMVHICFSFILFVVIILFKSMNNDAIINQIFLAAGYTYGPLLGLFTFGLFTNRSVQDKYVWLVCLAAPILAYVINTNSATWLGGFQFGFLIVALNGFLTFAGLLIISSQSNSVSTHG